MTRGATWTGRPCSASTGKGGRGGAGGVPEELCGDLEVPLGLVVRKARGVPLEAGGEGDVAEVQDGGHDAEDGVLLRGGEPHDVHGAPRRLVLLRVALLPVQLHAAALVQVVEGLGRPQVPPLRFLPACSTWDAGTQNDTSASLLGVPDLLPSHSGIPSWSLPVLGFSF